MTIDGAPACPRCGRRPRQVIPAGTKAYARGRRHYGYCSICAAAAEQERRQRLEQERRQSLSLSPAERELILELRKVQPTGRHHAPDN